MAKLREIIVALERLAPLKLQDEWDNSGLQVGFPDADISRVLVCLDVTEAIVEEAIAKKCPRFVFCGHIHTGQHGGVDFESSRIYNVSRLDERYEIAYEPTWLDV